MKIKVTFFMFLLTYLIPARGEFLIRPYVSESTLELVMRNAGATTGEANLKPSVSTVNGIVLGIGGLSISYGQNMPQSDDDIQSKGKSTYSDYQIQLYYGHFGLDIYDQEYKGFYHSTIQVSEGGDQYKLPNMTMSKVGGNLFYVFSPKDYSINASYGQTERQTKSGYSFIAMATVNEIQFANGGEPVLFDGLRERFGENSELSGATMKTYGGSAGIGATKVFSSWYYSAQLLAGFAKQDFTATGIANTSTQNLTAKLLNMRISAGYNGKTFFAGVLGIIDKVTTKVSNFEIEPTSTKIEGFFGARF
jgi:hypothetical protein